jgi:hypothetical protein
MSPRRLTKAEEAEIRKLYDSTAGEPTHRRTIEPNPERWTYERLGKRYAVSRETIRRVLQEVETDG